MAETSALVICLLNKHPTRNAFLIVNPASAHDGKDLALLSGFDFLPPKARLTNSLLLHEVVLHQRGNGSV